MTNSELDHIFTYQLLTDEQRTLCRMIFAGAHQFAKLINQLPESREKSLAITALQNTLLWCDAAIAIHPPAPTTAPAPPPK